MKIPSPKSMLKAPALPKPASVMKAPKPLKPVKATKPAKLATVNKNIGSNWSKIK